MRSSRRGAAETNLTRSHEVSGSIPGLAQRVKDRVLPPASVKVVGAAQIRYCHGCDVGWQLPLIQPLA